MTTLTTEQTDSDCVRIAHKMAGSFKRKHELRRVPLEEVEAAAVAYAIEAARSHDPGKGELGPRINSVVRFRLTDEFLRKALEEIARQKLHAEITDRDPDELDWLGGYEGCVKRARSAIAETAP